MKKIPSLIVTIILAAAVLGSPVLAATTVSLVPARVNAIPGQNFNVIVIANPQGLNNYVAKIDLAYPADLLEVRSFRFGNGWLPLNQPGYDLIDNSRGLMIKTAGFPGGVSTPLIFGTITFRAKKTGGGSIGLGNGSLLLDRNGQNVLVNLPTAVVAIRTPSIVPPRPAAEPAPGIDTPTTPEELKPAGVPLTEIVPLDQPVDSEPSSRPPTIPPSSLLTAVGGILTLGTDNLGLGLLVGLIILAAVVYLISLARKKQP